MDNREWPVAHQPVTAKQTRWPLAWTFWIDLLIIALLFVIVNLSVGAVIATRAFQQGLPLLDSDGRANLEQFTQLLGTTGFLMVVLIQCVIFTAVPIVRVALLRHEPLAQIGFQAARPILLTVQGIGLGALMLVLNIMVGALFRSIGITQNQTEQLPLFAGDVGGQLLVALAATVLAPLGEEVLFRGYAFNAFLQQWGAPTAYLSSALLFSIAHSLAATQGLIALLVPAFVIGLVLALGMHYTRSLLPCIIAHAFNNGIAISVAILCVNNPTLCPS